MRVAVASGGTALDAGVRGVVAEGALQSEICGTGIDTEPGLIVGEKAARCEVYVCGCVEDWRGEEGAVSCAEPSAGVSEIVHGLRA